MSIHDHQQFYKTLYELWFQRLNLTHQDRERIVPEYSSDLGKLFKFSPELFHKYANRARNWWEKNTIHVMEALITRSPDKEYNKLGTLYCVMGLVKVNEDAADGFPWLLEAMN